MSTMGDLLREELGLVKVPCSECQGLGVVMPSDAPPWSAEERPCEYCDDGWVWRKVEDVT